MLGFMLLIIFGFLILMVIGMIKQNQRIQNERREHQLRMQNQALYDDDEDDDEEPWSEDLPYDPFAYHKNWQYDRRYSGRPGNIYYEQDWGLFDDMLQHRNDD